MLKYRLFGNVYKDAVRIKLTDFTLYVYIYGLDRF